MKDVDICRYLHYISLDGLQKLTARYQFHKQRASSYDVSKIPHSPLGCQEALQEGRLVRSRGTGLNTTGAAQLKVGIRIQPSRGAVESDWKTLSGMFKTPISSLVIC